MDINTENKQLTKHQRYYRKNRERRKLEKSLWQQDNREKVNSYSKKYKQSIKGYITTRKYDLTARREKIVNKLKELENVN